MRFVAAVLFTGALLFAQSANIGSNHDAGPPQSPHPAVRLQLGESSTTGPTRHGQNHCPQKRAHAVRSLSMFGIRRSKPQGRQTRGSPDGPGYDS